MGTIERFKEYTVALEEAYHDDDWLHLRWSASRKVSGRGSLSAYRH